MQKWKFLTSGCIKIRASTRGQQLGLHTGTEVGLNKGMEAYVEVKFQVLLNELTSKINGNN